MKAKFQRKNKGKQIATLISALTAGAAGIASAEQIQPMTYFQSDGIIYQMDERANIVPENDAKSKFIQNSSGRWFLDRNSNSVQDTGEEFNAPKFTDEATKSLNFAKAKTKNGVKAITYFRYPDNQNPSQKNVLVVWNDGTISLGPYQYSFDAQWFYDSNGNGVKDTREGSMNVSFNSTANTQLRQVMKLASEVRDAYQKSQSVIVSGTSSLEEKAKYEAEITRLTTRLTEAVKENTERTSELEKLARESQSNYQTAVSETQLYKQKLADVQRQSEVPAQVSTPQTQYQAPVASLTQPVQNSVPASQPSDLLLTQEQAYPSTVVKTEEQKLAELANREVKPVETNMPSVEPTQAPAKETSTKQIQGTERTVEDIYLGIYPAQTPVEMTLAEANRIERECHQKMLTEIYSRVYTPTQPIEVAKIPKERKKVNMPIGMSLDFVAGTGGLGVRKDINDSLTAQGATGYLGGRLGVSIPTRNPKLALGVTFNGAYGFDELVDSVQTEPTATGRYFAGSVTNSSFVQGAIGMELQAGENFYFGTAIGAWINGERTYEGLYNAAGEEIKANTTDRIKASPSIDVYAGIAGGRKMPIRFTGGWNSRKGIYGALGFQIYPTKKEN